MGKVISGEIVHDVKQQDHDYMAVKPMSLVSKRLFLRLGVFGALPVSGNPRVTSSLPGVV
jgi:hypothetical protein